MPAVDPIILSVVLVSVIDIIVVVVRTPTTSRRIWVVSNRLSLAPYALGVLCGHVMTRSDIPLSTSLIPVFMVATVGVTLSVMHWLWWTYLDAPDWLPFIHLLVGCGMGATFIPMS